MHKPWRPLVANQKEKGGSLTGGVRLAVGGAYATALGGLPSASTMRSRVLLQGYAPERLTLVLRLFGIGSTAREEHAPLAMTMWAIERV